MHEETGQAYSKFNDEAARIFFSLFNEFLFKVQTIDREGNENLFQLIKSHFSEKLNLSLHGLASDLITDCQNPDLKNSLHSGLSQHITYYLNEFDKKANTMD